jgi:hypothetical protein
LREKAGIRNETPQQNEQEAAETQGDRDIQQYPPGDADSARPNEIPSQVRKEWIIWQCNGPESSVDDTAECLLRHAEAVPSLREVREATNTR